MQIMRLFTLYNEAYKCTHVVVWECLSDKCVRVCELNSVVRSRVMSATEICLETCSLQNDLESKILVVFLLRKKLGGHHKEKIVPFVCSWVFCLSVYSLLFGEPTTQLLIKYTDIYSYL